MKKLSKMTMVLWMISLVPTLLSAEDFHTVGRPCCCPDNPVYLSYQPSTYDVEFKALCLKPASSALHYATQAESIPLSSANWRIGDVRPSYHFGFELGANLYLHERNSRLRADFIHFHSQDNTTRHVPSGQLVGPSFEVGSDGALYNRAQGRAHFHYDALNLDYAVCVDFGSHLHANFFAGLSGARIKQTLTSTYSNQGAATARKIKTPSSFLGMGPELGVDFSYGIYKGLRLTGKGTAALLVGNLKNHTSYKSISPLLAELGIASPNTQFTHVNDRMAVVPAFEGKVGLAYAFMLCDYLVDVDVGYQVLYYINAIQSVNIASEVDTPSSIPDGVGVFAGSFQRNLSDFALAGPYLKVNVSF